MSFAGAALFLFLTTSSQVTWTFVTYFPGENGLKNCIEMGPRLVATILVKVVAEGFTCVPVMKMDE